jgi:TRAP transporter TAXI family solute receptor
MSPILSKKAITRTQAIAIVVIILIAVIGGYAWYAAQPGPAPARQPVKIRFATFSTGSGWYIMGEAMASVMRKALPEGSTVDVLPYTGGLGNPLLLGEGKADIALGFPVESTLAIKGIEMYNKSIPGIVALAGGLDTYWYAFAVRAETGIKSFEDIKARKYPLKLAVLTKGSSGEWTTRKVLEAYGITYDDIISWGGSVSFGSFSAALEKMKDGSADAFGQMCTPRHPTWTEMANAVNLRFIPLREDIMDQLCSKYGYIKSRIPKGEFKGVDEDVPALGFYTMLITTKDLPEWVAYAITKAICEKRADWVAAYKASEVFDPKTAWKVPIPLHPGAERYYREMGYMK